MASITYPFALTAGAVENINQLNSNLTAITDQFNGNIEAGQMASAMKPGNLLGSYHTIITATYGFSGGNAAGLWLCSMNGSLANDNTALSTASGAIPMIQPLHATDYVVTGLTAKLRLRAILAVNSVAPASNFTFGLHQVQTHNGTGDVTVNANDTAVTGSTVTRTAPAASTGFLDASADFVFPATASYVLGITTSATQATNSGVFGTIALQVRHV